MGFTIRYISGLVENNKRIATLVCGNAGNNWDLETSPNKDYGKKETEEHRESMEREKKNYFHGKETQEFK